jgi:hypothetical protein
MNHGHRHVDGVLLLYHHFPADNAPTIREHVESFARHSRFPVFAVNTDRGFPRALRNLRFRAIVLHYSLFGGSIYLFGRRFLDYLADSDSYKIAFFQDEHRFCAKRFAFLDEYGVDAVYTLLEPEYHEEVYGDHTQVATFRRTFTGYVSDDLVELAKRLTIPDDDRTVDVGYRARQLAFWMGRGSQEKHEIGARFLERAPGLGLTVDIATGEQDRIYGDAWYEFVANCRGMLGVEAGTSIFDLDDTARERCEALLAREPDLDFEEVSRRLLHEYEGNIEYRTISPRHFEAAAFRVAQILYRGAYQGVLEADVHYFALEKDFSNFDDVMARFRDPAERRRITDRAYDDLIASGRYSYESFVAGLDEGLAEVGVTGAVLNGERRRIQRALTREHPVWSVAAHPIWYMSQLQFPGRPIARRVYKAVRQFRGE